MYRGLCMCVCVSMCACVCVWKCGGSDVSGGCGGGCHEGELIEVVWWSWRCTGVLSVLPDREWKGATWKRYEHIASFGMQEKRMRAGGMMKWICKEEESFHWEGLLYINQQIIKKEGKISKLRENYEASYLLWLSIPRSCHWRNGQNTTQMENCEDDLQNYSWKKANEV